MPEVSAQRKTFGPFRAVNRSISPFISNLGLQIGVPTEDDRNARSWRSQSPGIEKRDRKREKDFAPYGIKVRQCRRVERLGITRAQGNCADPLEVKRLPAHREFGLLRVILRMLRGE